MNELFVDTSGWACLADRREQHHALAVTIYHNAKEQKRQLITTNYVLAELVSLLSSPKQFPRSMVISFIESIKAAPHVEVVHIDPTLDMAAWQLLKTRLDKQWSLVDCASCVVMEQRGITQALTTDHHFEQAGFVRLLKP